MDEVQTLNKVQFRGAPYGRLANVNNNWDQPSHLRGPFRLIIHDGSAHTKKALYTGTYRSLEGAKYFGKLTRKFPFV